MIWKNWLQGLQIRALVSPREVTETVVLTSFATEMRYPGFGEPVSKGEYEQAVRQAKAVVNWALEVVGKEKRKGA